MTEGPATVPLLPDERELLLRLMELPTAGPLEVGAAGPPPRLAAAQRAYAKAAATLGFTVLHHAEADPSAIEGPEVPAAVREAAAASPDFLACQPNMVLRLGPELPRERTVMFNAHLDTVAGGEPPRLDGDRFHGRGAIDAKGPAVALLAGIRAAVAGTPMLGRDIGVLIQLVSGEEGGAMGVFGTRDLVRRGHTGRLNIFCEPTGGRLLPRSTAAMTARVSVHGQDTIDDRPGGGHNATVLLGHVAAHLARRLPGLVPDTRVCVAGLHTGELHNRVYGTGRLLLNLAYPTTAAGTALEAALERELAAALDLFVEEFAALPDFARTAADARSVVTLDWLKRGLPALDAHDPWAERLVAEAGIPLAAPDDPAFTCDAIWLAGVDDSYTAVFGPGDLDANQAHAEGEFADAADLEHYAGGVARLLDRFARATNGAA
ncbi:M20/M25/M40 family metallo-hydrolase [Streptomyces sp. NBRC 109706]|uniref:M20/M25/M40 family metallo-hydrolase n=1 Tax=Streptomyces sp. NBRC 109706 TaxID=1550035 RepID=UPI000780CE04|nr:M20/M25/M40 family metallo-hydrolase [Streptomyces sp. NBRC 109706]